MRMMVVGLVVALVGCEGKGAPEAKDEPVASAEAESSATAEASASAAPSASAPVHEVVKKILVEGRLPSEIVERIVRQNIERYRKCYADTFGEDHPKVALTMVFTIGRDGKVKKAAGKGDGSKAVASLGTCLADAVTGLSFPQPEEGEVKVKYPFFFGGAEDDAPAAPLAPPLPQTK